jgi:hypothetical protein
MLKRIPKSDISIRPFKAYKEWSFNESSTGSISLLEAELGQYDSSVSNIITTGNLIGSSFNKHSVYGQLRAQFYNGEEDNVFTITGDKRNSYVTGSRGRDRFLSGSAKVISIPNVYVGEGIKKGSLILIDDTNTANEVEYTDDSYGNLKNNYDALILNYINVQDAELSFTDYSDNDYLANINTSSGSFDVNLSFINIIYNGQPYTITFDSIDLDSGILISNTPLDFLPDDAHGIKIGNIFYNQGLVVLTRDIATKLQNQWTLDYKSTETIYEHEYLLIANEDEFNVSTNPSAIVEVGNKLASVTNTGGTIQRVTTNTGVKYIKKLTTLENGNILDYRFSGSVGSTKAGFEHYDLSGSVDSTGSFLAPFITTIGLYDDNCELVAVAKLPQPIKSEPDIPVNFIIRFDT